MTPVRLPFLLFAILLSLALLAPPAQAQQRFKPIFEPVNYPGDFRLHSVFFVNGSVGWASGSARQGKGGVILHTTNGGEKWDIQLGEQNSQEAEYQNLYFLDAKHGWAFQYGPKLLRTVDGGRTWAEAGSAPGTWLTAMAFTTPQRGVAITGSANDSRINSTQNGGRNWKADWQCVAQVELQGLTRRVGCSLFDMHFPTANVGYAAGGAYNGGFSIIVKTEDAGLTWKAIFVSPDVNSVTTINFTDEKRGVIATRDYKTYVTEDGGQTWRGIPATIRGKIRFADPSVGWACWQRGCAVTSDGGATWSSRDLNLPATIQAFSAPRRDRVFLIGDHGMVYRYRVVPADYTAKGIHNAPGAPGYGSELASAVAGMQAKVRDLQAKAGSGNEALVKEASFAQALAAMESDAGAIARQAPAFAERYRNLNVLHIGMNMLDDLKGRASGIGDGVAALRGASDLKTATAALQELAGRLDDTSSALSNGFQHLAAAEAPAGGGTIRNMAGQSAAPAQAPQPAGGQQAGGQQQQNQQGGAGVDQAAEQAKRALQRFLKF